MRDSRYLIRQLKKRLRPRSRTERVHSSFFFKGTRSAWLTEKAFAVAVTSILVTIALTRFELNDIEATLYDLKITSATQPQRPPEVVLIAMDDRSLQTLDEQIPCSIDVQTQVLESLVQTKPRAIGWLLETQLPQALSDTAFSTQSKRRFVDAVSLYESQGGSFTLGTSYSQQGEVIPPFPLNQLDHAPAIIHRDGNIFAEDKITRRAVWSISGAPTFHARFITKLGANGSNYPPSGTFRDDRAEYFFFRWTANPELQFNTDLPIDVRDIKKSHWKIFSGLDLLHGKIPESELKDKWVLVGSLSRDHATDFAFTPWSRKPFTNPKLSVHATILESIRSQETIIRGHPYWSHLITLLASAFVISCVFATSPVHGLLATLSLALGFIVASQLFFSIQRVWIPSAHVLAGIIASYYVAVPYRLYREYRARWEFQERNKFLTQVEEMKRNFVSLVTHDLKTPVARIQGLTEILARKASERLNDRDQDTLKQILISTDELNRFITSILELNRIDTAGEFSLQLDSRDINQLIEKAAQDFKAQAKSKGTRIELDLEPQFPIRFDTALIRRVIHNLIDNALKYSNPGSFIKLMSRDLAASEIFPQEGVEIQIQDQGIGIEPADMEKLFSRFYRVKNDHTTRVTGTGLGLYLSRYFIEAHGGTLTAKSEPGKGSTFIIRLPVSPPQGKESSLTILRPGLSQGSKAAALNDLQSKGV